MNLVNNICSSLFPCSIEQTDERSTESAIDASMRWPALALIKAAAFWFVLAIAFGLIVSIKLHSPSFLGDSAALTYGKVKPIFWNTLVYGFIFNAGLASGSWILARLSGQALGFNLILAISATAWNVGVTVGVVGILIGDQQPFGLLEFPTYVAPFLLIAFMGIAIWGLLVFRNRVFRSSFASQWYLLMSLFCFVWIYSVALAMLFCAPVQGSFQALVNAWYVDCLLGLVLAPFAIAVFYYLIPKSFGQPIVGYRYAGIAFWTWALCNAFRGSATLLNGPIPSWIPILGMIAGFSLLLPVSTFAMQFLSSLFANFNRIWDSVSIRFVFVGAVSFIVFGVLEIYGSFVGVNETIQFSFFDSGVSLLALLGFIGMTLMGAIYFILPRVLNKNLPSSLIEMQFWSQTMGVLMVGGSMIFGGQAQGELINQSAGTSFVAIAQVSQSFLFLTTFGMVFLLFSAVAFLVSFFWMIVAARSSTEQSALFVKAAPDMEWTV